MAWYPWYNPDGTMQVINSETGQPYTGNEQMSPEMLRYIQLTTGQAPIPSENVSASQLIGSGNTSADQTARTQDQFFKAMQARIQWLASPENNPVGFAAFQRLGGYLNTFGPAGMENLFNIHEPGGGQAADLYDRFPFLNPAWNPQQGPAITEAGYTALKPKGVVTEISGPGGTTTTSTGNTGSNLSPQQLYAGFGGTVNSGLSSFFGEGGVGADLFNPSFDFSNVDIPGLSGLTSGISGLETRLGTSGLGGQVSGLSSALQGLYGLNGIGGLQSGLSNLQSRLSSLETPNLSTLTSNLNNLGGQVSGFQQLLSNLSVPSTDSLNALFSRIPGLQSSVSGLTGTVGGLQQQLSNFRLPDTASLSGLLAKVPDLANLLGPNGLQGLASTLAKETMRLESVGGGGGRLTAGDFSGILNDQGVRTALQGLLPTSGGLTPTGLGSALWDLGGTENDLLGIKNILTGNQGFGGISNIFDQWMTRELDPTNGKIGRLLGSAQGNPFNTDELFTRLDAVLNPLTTRVNDLWTKVNDPTFGQNNQTTLPPEIFMNLSPEVQKLLEGTINQDLGYTRNAAPNTFTEAPGATTPGMPSSGQINFEAPKLEMPAYTDYTEMMKTPYIGALMGRLQESNPFDVRMQSIIAGPEAELDKKYKDAENALIHQYATLSEGNPMDSPRFREELRLLQESKAREKLGITSQFQQQAAALDPSWKSGILNDISAGIGQEFGRANTNLTLQDTLQRNATDDFYKYMDRYQAGYMAPYTQQDEGLRMMLGGIGSTLAPDMNAANNALTGVQNTANSRSSNNNAALGNVSSSLLQWALGKQGNGG
jgi:hypothetical protein